MKSNLVTYSMRLKPGEELKSSPCSLLKFVKDNNLKAPFILTCCGSVTMATLRFAASQQDGKVTFLSLLNYLVKKLTNSVELCHMI